jgi:organic hydroperoxide reductase OsmC/OhrA
MRLALLVLVASACFAQESLTLADAEALALKQHPQIAGARLITQASGQVTKEVRSNLYPTLTGARRRSAPSTAAVWRRGFSPPEI